jgi:hypothetical protein
MACTATLKGRASLKGNVPHTYPALTTDSGAEYEIIGEKRPLFIESLDRSALFGA